MPRAYACPFFSPEFSNAAEYGSYVQQYRVGRRKLLGFKTPESRAAVLEFTGHDVVRGVNDPVELDLFWHPTAEWVGFLSAAGYDGTKMGWNICLFNADGVDLIGRYRVDWSRQKSGKPQRVRIL